MNYKNAVMLVLLVLTGQHAHELYAGAWPQPKGSGYYKLGFRVISAREFYEPDGTRIDIPRFAEYTTSLYGERGLTDAITFIASVPFFKRITLNRQVHRDGTVAFAGDAKNGFSDVEVGARWRFWRNSHSVFSLEAIFGLPIGDSSQENGLLTGDGEFNQALKLQYGYSGYPRPFYFTADVGYNNRTEGYSDEFSYSAEVGYTLTPSWLLAFKIRGLEWLEANSDAMLGGMGGLYANRQRYLAFGPEISCSITRNLGVTLAVEGATRGQNVLSAPAFSLGFYWKQ